MTAQGKITTAKLVSGTEILATREGDRLMVATRRTGSIIVKVESRPTRGEPSIFTGSRPTRWFQAIRTDHGVIQAHGHNAHFLATDNDRKRVNREARKTADRSQVAADSATVLAGVTSLPAQTFTRVEGTVMVDGEERAAKQDTDGLMYFREGGEWAEVRQHVGRVDPLTFTALPSVATGDVVRQADGPTGLSGTVLTIAGRAMGTDLRVGEVHVQWGVSGPEQIISAARLIVVHRPDTALDAARRAADGEHTPAPKRGSIQPLSASSIWKSSAICRECDQPIKKRPGRGTLWYHTTETDIAGMTLTAPDPDPMPAPAVAPQAITTQGTVRRGGRTLPARHTVTKWPTGDVVSVEFQPRGDDWLPASKTVAGTFSRTLGTPAAVKPAAPAFSDALTEALAAVLPDPKKVATARMADGRQRAAERRSTDAAASQSLAAQRATLTRRAEAMGFEVITDVIDGEQASGIPATTKRGAAAAQHFPKVTILGSPIWARPVDAAANFRALAAATTGKAQTFWIVQAGVAESHAVDMPRPKL